MTHLREKYFEQLSRDEKTAFWTYQFPIEYLPTNDETIINGIFQRINKNTARLTRQELRHARFGGLFIGAAEDLAEQMSKALPENFPRLESQSRKQMKDVELVANLLLSLEEGIKGYSQDELDVAFSDQRKNGRSPRMFAIASALQLRQLLNSAQSRSMLHSIRRDYAIRLISTPYLRRSRDA